MQWKRRARYWAFSTGRSEGLVQDLRWKGSDPRMLRIEPRFVDDVGAGCLEVRLAH